MFLNNEDWKDDAVQRVESLRDKRNLIESFLLCSTFIEHYCKTKLFLFLTTHRPLELYKVKDVHTKKLRKVFPFKKMNDIIKKFHHSQIIDIGFLIGVWNMKLYSQLKKFNSDRNNLIHKYENLLEILEKDEEKLRSVIERGINTLNALANLYN